MGLRLNDKRVDIIVPCYNGAQFLRQTLDSALAQTHPNVHVLVIDDGSTDSSRQIVKSYRGRVGYVYKDNGGQASARNAGIRCTTSEYVCFLDADDIILPGMIAALVNHLEQHPQADMCHASTLAFKGNDITQAYAEHWRPFVAWKDYLEPLSLFCAIHGSSAVMRRRVFESWGVFPEDRAVQGCEDWHFWLQAVLKGAVVHYIPAVYTLYRQHPSASSAQYQSIAARESELMRRAVNLFRENGITDEHHLRILAYGIKYTSIRWARLAEREKFRELVSLSESIIDCAQEDELVRKLFNRNDRIHPSLLHFALCNALLKIDLPVLAAVVFVTSGNMHAVRRHAERLGYSELFQTVVDFMEKFAGQHRGERGPDWDSSGHPSAGSATADPSMEEVAAHIPQFATFFGHVQHQVAAAHRHNGRLEEAELLYRRALDLNPYYFHSHMGLSVVCFKKRELFEALEHFKRALALDREALVFEVMDTLYLFLEERLGMEPILAKLKSSALYKKITLDIKKAISLCVRAMSCSERGKTPR